MSDQQTQRIQTSKSELEAQIKEAEDQKTRKKASALDSIRSWTNGQIVLARALLFAILVYVAKQAFYTSNQIAILNQLPYYSAMAFLVILIYFTYDFEKRNNNYNDTRAQEQQERRIKELSQQTTLLYIFDQILPDENLGIEDKLNILKKVALIVQEVSAADISEAMTTGFQLMADTMSSLRDSFDLKARQMTAVTESTIDEILKRLHMKGTIPQIIKDIDKSVKHQESQPLSTKSEPEPDDISGSKLLPKEVRDKMKQE